MTPPTSKPVANNLDAFFMPFTANRQFKANPRMLAKAKGMHYWTPEGRKIIDGTAGLWCVNAGHGREEIKAAILPAARRDGLRAVVPDGPSRGLRAGGAPCGAAAGRPQPRLLLQLRLRGCRHRAQDRARLSPRPRPGHAHAASSAASAAITASASAASRSAAWSTTASGSARCCRASITCRTPTLAQNAFSKGQPEHGAELADALEGIVGLHDASNIAAVIVEPCAGSTGYLPPPKGYLERLREICDKHGILLIFDEVITGFGRLGASFAAEKFGVIPDLMTVAKGISNATVPMGGVFVSKPIYDGADEGPGERDRAVPRLHLFGPSAGLRRGLGGARHL